MERFWNPPTPCGSRSPCALRRKDECRFSRIFQIELECIYPKVMIRLPEKGYNPALTRSKIDRNPVLGYNRLRQPYHVSGIPGPGRNKQPRPGQSKRTNARKYARRFSIPLPTPYGCWLPCVVVESDGMLFSKNG